MRLFSPRHSPNNSGSLSRAGRKPPGLSATTCCFRPLLATPALWAGGPKPSSRLRPASKDACLRRLRPETPALSKEDRTASPPPKGLCPGILSLRPGSPRTRQFPQLSSFLGPATPAAPAPKSLLAKAVRSIRMQMYVFFRFVVLHESPIFAETPHFFTLFPENRGVFSPDRPIFHTVIKITVYFCTSNPKTADFHAQAISTTFRKIFNYSTAHRRRAPHKKRRTTVILVTILLSIYRIFYNFT